MEKIDLTNYEAYFLDYIEGTLSEEEKHDLYGFLKENPGLKSELENDFDEVILLPKSIHFEEKESLRIDKNSFIITPGTVEEIMIAAVENNLSAENYKTLQSYIDENQLEKTFDYYKSTILKPDNSIVFEEKGKLKVSTGIVISLALLARIGSVAAAAIILLGIGFNWGNDGRSNEGVNVADNNLPFFESSDSRKQTDYKVKSDQKNQLELAGRFSKLKIDEAPENSIDVNYNNFIAEETPELKEQLVDSSFVVKEDVLNDENLVKVDKEIQEEKQNIDKEKEQEESFDDVTIVLENNAGKKLKKEEPYKIITNVASSIVNQEVSFTREKDVASNDYVNYSFKLGKFEFERKKGRKL